MGLQRVTKLGDAPVHLGDRRILGIHPRAHILERRELVPACAVLVIAVEVIDERVVSGERRGEDHAGIVAQRVGQAPTVRQLGTERRGVVVVDEREAGVAQRVQARADRQPGAVVERRVAFGVDAELLNGVEGSVTAGQLDDVPFAFDRLEDGFAAVALHQPGDVLVGYLAPNLTRD